MTRILIVDDSALLCERISDFLSSMGMVEVVGSATRPLEALEGIQMHNPDVVILDLHLVGGSGLEVLEGLQTQTKRPKVIVLTNYPYDEYRKKCLTNGAMAFLDKTTEFGKLTYLLTDINTQISEAQWGQTDGNN